MVPRHSVRIQRRPEKLVTFTEYAWMTTDELLLVVANKASPSALEVELGERLAVYAMTLEEADDTRGARQASS